MTRIGKTGITAVILLIFLAGSAHSQQFPIMDQYLVSPSSISPAFVGKDVPFEVFLTSRIEWTNITDHPFIGSLNLAAALPKSMGVGGNILYNVAGPLENLTINLNYAYHLKVAADHMLSFGINGAYYQNVLDLTNAVIADPNDPVLAGRSSISESYFNVGLGLLYSWRTLDACVTFPLLFNNKTFYNSDKVYSHVLTLDRNFLVYLGYLLQPKGDWGAHFSFLYRQTQYTPWSFDVAVRAIYKDMISFGLLYRKNNVIGITGGLSIAKGLKFNYTYEYSPSAMMGKSSGTHEITLGYKMLSKSVKPSMKDYIK
ncbi:MAG: PorP/SprF family type IX secretion system membrane protein [Bacteroidales bacterium]|nr:PorP/SprF family type IX secretion system membrane protein [Bacteroidales bacterium]